MIDSPVHMFRATCKSCGWLFDVCAVPMPLAKAAVNMANATCPLCGNREGNTVGAARPLTDDEMNHKTHKVRHA
jgi:hypothetical protein